MVKILPNNSTDQNKMIHSLSLAISLTIIIYIATSTAVWNASIYWPIAQAISLAVATINITHLSNRPKSNFTVNTDTDAKLRPPSDVSNPHVKIEKQHKCMETLENV